MPDSRTGTTDQTGAQPAARRALTLTAILAAIVYTVIMAAGWLVNRYDYGTVSNLFWVTPFLLLAIVFTYALIRRYRIPIASAGRLRTPWMMWVVILIIFVDGVGLTYSLTTGFAGHRTALAGIFVATMMVGFAEEGMFRGFLITSLARRMSIGKALVISSVMFGLLHSVNVLAHAEPLTVGVQVLFTLLVGYVLGTVYIRSDGSIVLVAILHGVYDFIVFSTGYATATGGQPHEWITFANLFLWILLAIVLGIRNAKGLPDLPGTRRATW
jgi:membrane protease YdiL (CAAX protease family)